MEDTIQIPDTVMDRIDAQGRIDLELGCGSYKRHPDAVGIDALDYEGVDIVGDIYQVLKTLPDRSVGNVYSYHCLEHLPDLGAILDELARLMGRSSVLKIVVPHFSNPYYYSDYTHRHPFGLYTLSYFAKDPLFTRRTPTYQRTLCFELAKVTLVFKAERPFYFRWLFKKAIQMVVNRHTYLMEFYEENLCWLFPCYEVTYELNRL